MFRRLRQFWHDLFWCPVVWPKGYRPQDHPTCDLKCCGTCKWYKGRGIMSGEDSVLRIDFALFGCCSIATEGELRKVENVKVNSYGGLTMTGPPVINRHFFQVCPEYLRKKGN